MRGTIYMEVRRVNIPVAVDGQRMMLQDSSYRFAPRSQEFVKFVFELSDDWMELTTFAQFTQNGSSYNTYLDEDNSVYLPGEIVSGSCTMMLYGTGAGGVTGTTLPIVLCIDNDCFTEDGQSTVITQSLYDQLVAQVAQYVPLSRIATLAEAKAYLGI